MMSDNSGASQPDSGRTSAQRPYQARVGDWMRACFGEAAAKDVQSRGDRLLKEVLELLQACGYDAGRVGSIRDYVFTRPVGVPDLAAGSAQLTLAAYCCAAGIDLEAAAEQELLRVWSKIDRIRAKVAARRGSASPLPIPQPGLTISTIADRHCTSFHRITEAPQRTRWTFDRRALHAFVTELFQGKR